jgi:hypothetical protein
MYTCSSSFGIGSAKISGLSVASLDTQYHKAIYLCTGFRCENIAVVARGILTMIDEPREMRLGKI